MVMLFELANTLAAFVDIKNRDFQPFFDLFVVVFIDDILVYSRGDKDHENHLGLVLKTLKEHQLFAKLNKCEFWINEVKFLNHVISKKEVTINPSKIETIVGW